MQDIEFVVSYSASRIHAINLCESVDENLERILLEQRYTDEDAKKLAKHYTFRLCTNGMIFDARDIFEILELSRCMPN